MPEIWCVEDDVSINELYSCVLESYGFNYKIFESAEAFWEALKAASPDLILLDVMLPGEDGFDILGKLRGSTVYNNIAVLFVSAKGDELSKVRGLNMGANDYITKPFGVMELVARVNANLRNKGVSPKRLTYKDIGIDDDKRAVTIGGTPAELTKKEYLLLRYLVANAGNTMEREAIFTSVWGEDFMGETRTLDMHIRSLRAKLKDAEIETVRGVGFKLK